MKYKTQLLDDLMIGLLFVLFLIVMSNGANVNISPGGDLYTATNNAGNGDTVFVIDGPAFYEWPRTSTSTLNQGVAVISVNGNDTIQKKPESHDCFTAGGTGITIKGFVFRWQDTIASGTTYFIYLANYGGATIYGNKFYKNRTPTSNAARCISLSRADSNTFISPTIIRKNYFDTMFVALAAADAKMGANDVTVDSNIWNMSKCYLGYRGKFEWNVSSKGGEFAFYGDSLKIRHNYGGGFYYGGAAEYYTTDDNFRYAFGFVIEDNMWDSLSHNTMWDGLIRPTFKRNIWRKSSSCFYNHNSNTADSSVGVRVENCWFDATSNFITIPQPNTTRSSDIRFTRSVFNGAGGISIAAIPSDTIDTCLFSAAPALTNVDVTAGNSTNITLSNYYIDTDKYHYIRQRNPLAVISTNDYKGPKKFLTNIKSEDSTENSISFACSLATDFRYWNRVFTWSSNTWFNGDTVQLTVQYCTDTSGSITSVVADTLTAGENATTTINGLSSGTKHFYRTIASGFSYYADTSNVLDTTAWYDVSTLESSGPVDTAKTVWHFPQHGKKAGGDTVHIWGTGFGSNPSVSGGTKINGSPTMVSLTVNSGTDSIRLVVTPSGGVPDTVWYYYDAVAAQDTVYVDSALTENTTSYNTTTRLGTGGTKIAYPSTQALVAARSDTGWTALVRDGTYTGFTQLSQEKGTSWVLGHYNEICNYPGEMPKFDGQNIYTFAFGDSSTSPEDVSVQTHYFKLHGLEIKNYRNAAGNKSTPVYIIRGPFKMDSCYIHDNYETTSIGSNNSSAFLGMRTILTEIYGNRFVNNGALPGTYSLHNCFHVQFFSDYSYTFNSNNGVSITTDSIKRMPWGNRVYENYFDSGVGAVKMFKGGEILSGRDESDNLPNDNLKMMYNEINNNVIRHCLYGIYMTGDYIQAHNNIVDSTEYGIAACLSIDEYPLKGVTIYNNTVIKSRFPIQFSHAYITVSGTQTPWYEGYAFNNVIDTIGVANDNAEELIYLKGSGAEYSTWNFDSSLFNHNLSYRQPEDSIVYFGAYNANARYTEASFNTAFPDQATVHYSVNTGTLYKSLYWADSTFVVDGGTTTISDGGIGGSHPILPSVTLPTYIGAGWDWQDDVLGLDSLGQPPAETIDPPVITVQPVNDTAVSGGTVSAFAVWNGDNVQHAYWYYHDGDSTYSTDSVLVRTVTAANDGDSAKWVLWNDADTISSNTIFFTVVWAAFDSVNTGDSNTVYVHGNFLSGSGWTATLSDSTLTTESGSATAQVFGYNHKIVLSTNKYRLVITNGNYTVTLYIGRRKSTGNNKPRISIDIGL